MHAQVKEVLLSFNCSHQAVAGAVDLSVSRLSLWKLCFTYLSGSLTKRARTSQRARARASEILGAWPFEVVCSAKQIEFREHVSASVIMLWCAGVLAEKAHFQDHPAQS